MITPEEVVALAQAGHVTPTKLAHALLSTYQVEHDGRSDHPHGYVAHTHNEQGEACRIEFDVARDAQGGMILIVTEWKDESHRDEEE